MGLSSLTVWYLLSVPGEVKFLSLVNGILVCGECANDGPRRRWKKWRIKTKVGFNPQELDPTAIYRIDDFVKSRYFEHMPTMLSIMVA